MAAETPAAKIQLAAAPLIFLYPIVTFDTFLLPDAFSIHMHWAPAIQRPMRVSFSEDLLSVQHQVETFAFLFLADTQADQHLGDHQQDQCTDTAIDKCNGDADALEL